MRITQGTFSFLPDLTDTQITKQLDYCLDKGWAIGIEYTDDPHPRNTYWEMYGNPMFDLADPAGVMMELGACRKTFPGTCVRLMAFDGKFAFDRHALAREPWFECSCCPSNVVRFLPSLPGYVYAHLFATSC